MSLGHLGDGHGRVDPEHPLSPREVEVIGLLCRGLRSKMIAQHLSISKNTVVTHIRNIKRKLEAHSRANVVGWAIESGLFDTSSGDVDTQVAAQLLTAHS